VEKSNALKNHLQYCKTLLEQKFNERRPVQHSDIERIQVGIFENTRQNLSRDTIRRLWGMIKYEGNFSKKTRNILAKSVGFSSWLELEKQSLGAQKKASNQQTDTMLIYCCNLLEEKFNDGYPVQHSDIERVQVGIFENTGENLSRDTIRRLWGMIKYEGNFQKSTRNILAKSVGFSSWLELEKKSLQVQKETQKEELNQSPAFPKTSISEQVSEENSSVSSEKLPPTESISQKSRFRLWTQSKEFRGGLLVMLLVGIGIGFAIQETPKVMETISDFSKSDELPFLTILYQQTDTAPSFVKLKYSLEKYAGDSVYIHWDMRDSNLLYQPEGILERPLAKPFCYDLRLTKNGKNLARAPVCIQSRGWTAVYRTNDNNRWELPMAHEECRFIKDGIMQFNEHKHKVTYMQFYNMKPLTVSGDDFTLEARIDNSEAAGGLPQYYTGLFVFGENGNRLILGVIEKGSTFNMVLHIVEKNVYGTEANRYLEQIGVPLGESGYHVYKLQKKGKYVDFFMDNELLYRDSSDQLMGSIQGIGIGFQGAGAVDWIKLYDQKNILQDSLGQKRVGRQGLVYKEDFDDCTQLAQLPVQTTP